MKTRLFLLFIVCVTGFFIGRADRFVDPDFWWQLAGGKLILSLGYIPMQDPFSYVSTLPVWFNHSWLWQIVAYFLFNRWSPDSLIIAKAVITTFIFGFCFWKSSATPKTSPVSTAFLILFTSLAFYYGTAVRPQLISFGLCALWLAWFPHLPDRRIIRFLFPITAVLWTNTHAFITIGLGLFLLFVLGTGWRREWEKTRLYIKIFLISGAITLINPYGTGLWKLFIRAVTFERSHASEALSVFSHWPSSWPYFLLLFICIISIVFSREKRNVAEMLVLGATAIYAARYSRLIPVFAIASWLYLPPHWTAFLGRITIVKKGWLRQSVVALAFLAVFYGMACVLWSIDRDVFRWDWKMKIAFVSDRFHTGFPVNMVQQMRRENVSGNIATPFVWGGYLIWNLAALKDESASPPDRCRVSFDGRYETVYPAEVCRENLAFEKGAKGWDTVLNKYPTNYALVFRGSVAETLLGKNPEWQRYLEDKEAVLFRKSSG